MKCRLCNYSKSFNKLVELKNFPRSAQQFLKLHEIKKDLNVTLKVIQCPMCELVQLDNEPVSYYKNVITAASINEASKKEIRKEFNKIIIKYDLPDTNVLEIGSATGDFLSVLNTCHVKAIGLENSKKNIKLSHKKKVKIINGYLLDNIRINKKFNFIICNNFLEHQPRIKNFIEKVHALLESDGIVYFSVPSLTRIIEKSCLYEFVTDHLVYFTEKTLKRAFETNGFEVLDSYYKNNKNDIVLIGKKRKLINLSHEKTKMSSILDSLKRKIMILKSKKKKVSVWGAGHRALAAMSISQIKEIDYVVDSAPFKQGLYTPILHKKIISPENFLRENCDVIIIMLPGNYIQQVKQFLKKSNFSGKIIAFNDEVIN